jgi:hypothetical protein
MPPNHNLINMDELKKLPEFTRANYHGDFPKGARFMLFEGPDSEGYVRISNSGDHHDDIVDRFMQEIRTKVAEQINEFRERGGGFYVYLDYNREDGKPLDKPKIVFHESSTTCGRFDDKLLESVLIKENLAEKIDWTITE